MERTNPLDLKTRVQILPLSLAVWLCPRHLTSLGSRCCFCPAASVRTAMGVCENSNNQALGVSRDLHGCQREQPCHRKPARVLRSSGVLTTRVLGTHRLVPTALLAVSRLRPPWCTRALGKGGVGPVVRKTVLIHLCLYSPQCWVLGLGSAAWNSRGE